ncbi:PadR family transcriptional regulator [Legionella sp. WA2022007384]
MKDRSRTKYTLLGMLAIRDLSGYEITKLIQTSTEYFWSESEGQIYPTLAKCVEEGFAFCTAQPANKIGHNKKIYSITEDGKRFLREWLKKSPKATIIRNELLLKLFYGHNVDKIDNIHHVIHRQKEIELTLERYKNLYNELIDEHKNSPHLKYWLLTLSHGIDMAEAELSWCRKSLKLLELDQPIAIKES